jgi:hypothetical protein
MGLGNYWTSQLMLEISPWQVVWPRVVVIAGLSMTFAPLNVAAFLYIPKEMRAATVWLLALLRNEGGSVGTSIAKTIQERREQFHSLRLGEYLEPGGEFLSPAGSPTFFGLAAIPLAPGGWHCSYLTICASNNPPRSPISTFSLCWPRFRFRSSRWCS